MTNWRWFLAILATIILGALGSGLWDMIFKPTLAWAVGTVLTISTLGLDSLRDEIYADVAMGNYERASLSILSLITGLSIPAITTTILYKYILDKVDKIKNNDKYRLTMKIVLYLYFLLLTTTLFFNMSSIVYTVHAQANLDRMYRTISPFISDEQRKLYISRMATISCRDDFVNIIDEMTDIARKNNIKVRTVYIF